MFAKYFVLNDAFCVVISSTYHLPLKDQGLTNESFPYEERALLFAFAFSWYTDTTDDDITASIEQKIKSNELEKKTWLLKMNAEIQKLETVCRTFRPHEIRNESKQDVIFDCF